MKLKRIDFAKHSLPDIQKEFQTLKSFYQELQGLMHTSKQHMENGLYDIDVVSIKHLEEFKRANPDLFHKINIVAKSTASSTAESFRNYIKTHNEPGVIREYLRIRTPELKVLDNKRAKGFRWGGAGIGALLFFMIMNTFLPVTLEFELGFISIGLLIFILGFAPIHYSLRFYSLALLLAYILSLINLSFLQGFHILPTSLHFERLREIYLLLIMSMVGGSAGLFMGIELNFLPSQTITLPNYLRVIDRSKIFLTVSFLLFGAIWTFAFKEEMNISEFVLTKIQDHIEEKTVVVAVITKEKVKPVAPKVLGKITVTASSANLCLKPVVTDSTKFELVVRGTVLNFYEFKTVEGDEWYLVVDPKSKKTVWIHGTTVKKL